MAQLVAMFPANIYVAVMELPAPGGLPASPWYTWSRLLFQPVLSGGSGNALFRTGIDHMLNRTGINEKSFSSPVK
jgi:uncharacterized membrane protein